jgi:Putative peptidoglycan binding domain/Penicillin-insensitive murein endopeptidase
MTNIQLGHELSDYLLPPHGGEDNIPETLDLINPYLKNLDFVPNSSIEILSTGVDEILSTPVDRILDQPGNGYYGYYSDSSRWGTSETILAIKEVGRIWSERGTRPRMGVGDISLKGGGPIDGHASHQKGVDIDIIPVRNDAKELDITIFDAAYSRELTQELIDLFYANSLVAVEFIFFNDSAVEGVQSWPNHDNHFHVRLFVPGQGPSTPISLKKGNFNPAVRELQRRLNFWLNTSAVSLPKLVEDADFGTNTEKAVMAFQKEQGLSIDGVVGKGTWSVLPIKK